MRTKLIASLALLVGTGIGCKTAYQSDKITVIRQRVFGIVVETAASTSATPTPNVKLGWSSTEFQLIPTATNATISTPNYVSTYQSDSGASPFSQHITENSGSGNIMIGTNGEGGAVIPKMPAPRITPK